MPGLRRSFATRPALAGQKIRCSGCKAGVRVPAANSFPVEHASRVVLNGLSGSSRAIAPTTGSSSGVRPPAGHRMSDSRAWDFPLDGDSGSSRSEGPTTERRSGVGPPAGDSIANARRAPLEGDSGFSHSIAPAPGAALRDGGAQTERDALLSNDQLEAIGGLTRREQAAVVLTSRGEMMEQVQQETARQEAAEITKNAEKAKKAKRKQRKKTSFFDLQETLTMLGGVGVVVAVLGFLAWRFPVPSRGRRGRARQAGPATAAIDRHNGQTQAPVRYDLAVGDGFVSTSIGRAYELATSAVPGDRRRSRRSSPSPCLRSARSAMNRVISKLLLPRSFA